MLAATAPPISPHGSGLSTCLYSTSVVVFGGQHTRYMWHLDLLGLEWSVEECTGAVPPPVVYHGAAIHDQYLLVCGGITPDEAAAELQGMQLPSPAIPYSSMRPLTVRVLDLAQLTWSTWDCVGETPTDRSHHTVTIVNGNLVLFGGKPLGKSFTNNQMLDFERAGFFDIHLLDLKSRMWRRVTVDKDGLEPLRGPRLWGHCAVSVESGAPGSRGSLLLHGGFAVSVQSGGSDDDMPVAELSDGLYVVNLDQKKWTQFSVPEFAPPARALHCAHMRGKTELVVFGGLTVDDDRGEIVIPNTTYLWSPVSGHWKQASSCYGDDIVRHMPLSCSRFPSVVYGTTIVVIHFDLTSISLFDGAVWTTTPCDTTSLTKPIEEKGIVPPHPFIATFDYDDSNTDVIEKDNEKDELTRLRAIIQELSSKRALEDAAANESSLTGGESLQAIMERTLRSSRPSEMISPVVQQILMVARDGNHQHQYNAPQEFRVQPSDVRSMLIAERSRRH